MQPKPSLSRHQGFPSETCYYQDTALRIATQRYAKEKSNMGIHAHPYLTISLLLEGSILEHTPQQTQMARSTAVFIKPAEAVHSNLFMENSTLISVNVLDWDYYPLPFSQIGIRSVPGVLPYFFRLLQDRDKRTALSELGCFLQKTSQPSLPEKVPDWLLTMKETIETHFQEGLSIQQLARDVGKHPVHLARTFTRHFGIDIKTYQRQLRIHQAVSSMVSQDQKLTHLAYENGFADQSHFSRAFKKETMLRPREAAKLVNV